MRIQFVPLFHDRDGFPSRPGQGGRERTFGAAAIIAIKKVRALYRDI